MASENETPASAATDISKDAASSAPQLPKLSAEEFRVYNRLAVMMDAYVSFYESSPLGLGCSFPFRCSLGPRFKRCC
jgi:hypothetical protein